MKKNRSRPNFPSLFIIIAYILIPSSYSQEITYPPIYIPNPRLMDAYIALQSWKLAIVSDPLGFTSNWAGPNVCNYTGVYCAPAPDNPSILTVAGIDLNHADIAGILPEHLGLLRDLALFHINSNRFCGKLPAAFVHLKLLHELDVSNNLFSGPFPWVVFYLPSLKFLDIRFNQFFGEIPPEIFDLQLDALFLNDNKFKSLLPANLGNSPVSVLVLANNFVTGCIPPSVAQMAETLDEIILANLGLTGCLRPEVGELRELKVLDLSCNKLVGELPESIGGMANLEQLNVGHNKFSGRIPRGICLLPKLENFIYSFNYFTSEPAECSRLGAGNDDRKNCIVGRPRQRSAAECAVVNAHPVDCIVAGSICPAFQ